MFNSNLVSTTLRENDSTIIVIVSTDTCILAILNLHAMLETSLTIPSSLRAKNVYASAHQIISYETHVFSSSWL